MKILTVFGTRPEIIRLSRIIVKLDQSIDYSGNQILMHTGQNYDPKLSQIFFKEMQIREPDYHFNIKGSFSEQMSILFPAFEKVIHEKQPDAVLILGDTNSSMISIVAKRMGIPVYHLEAGNRCYDDRVPEEVNRRVIDHSSDVLMPYTERSRQNLIAEGIPGNKIYVVGNPIKEVLDFYSKNISDSNIVERLRKENDLDLNGGFVLVTLHRQENVDNPVRLTKFLEAFKTLVYQYKMPIIWSVHPRTKNQIEKQKLVVPSGVFVSEPFGLFDFVHLEKKARLILTDSGTVGEEACIFHVPCVILRDTTERPEMIECGGGLLSGCEPSLIWKCAENVMRSEPGRVPPEYLVPNVSDVVVKIVEGFLYSQKLGF